MLAIDGGCAVIPYLQSGEMTATSAQFPGKMAALGVTAINTLAKTGKKPAATPGLGFYNTGTKLYTNTPIAGVPSGTTTQLKPASAGRPDPGTTRAPGREGHPSRPGRPGRRDTSTGLSADQPHRSWPVMHGQSRCAGSACAAAIHSSSTHEE